MAGYKTHFGGGLVVGICVGFYALSSGLASFSQSICLLIFGMIGGLLPDLDSDTGRPVKLLYSITAVACLLAVTFYAVSSGHSIDFIVTSGSITLIVCAALFFLFKRMTVHRGIMHSIPFALFVGTFTALLTSSWGSYLSTLVGVSMLTGVVAHLLLDELNSIGLKYGFIPYVKQSFGTAFKFTGDSVLSTVTLYAAIGITLCAYLFML